VALGAALAEPLAALAAPRHRRSRGENTSLVVGEIWWGIRIRRGGWCGGAVDLGWDL
jgi:hypothetical protein